MRNATLTLTNRAIRILYLHYLGLPTAQIARDIGLSAARTGVVLRDALSDPRLVTAGRAMLRAKNDARMLRLNLDD